MICVDPLKNIELRSSLNMIPYESILAKKIGFFSCVQKTTGSYVLNRALREENFVRLVFKVVFKGTFYIKFISSKKHRFWHSLVDFTQSIAQSTVS